ncbi:competence type IV pilus minor pilin ComGF [Aquibacillus rhizosphaerae]|uniref:Competence type IV pilus minor pilin ComGF n=1 Tax=Aquibacillus rhizosphaerae TaxID=3051431 RepID=A0ABT7LAH8_9BACI|nr:competence type IV pilus minor pilin ComGF [Aquibacillus sp. LR5S19]MDL4841555.1 competence type IV pilus minor pilin ComGF [Aquibacillus sp. LR5S19]
MQNKLKKNSAFTVIQKSEKGFSLISVLFALTVLFIMLPLIPFIFSLTDQTSFYDELATRQFFHFVTDELHNATNYSVNNSTLSLQQSNGDILTIEQYNQLIRRQLKGTGHEILLRDIKEMLIEDTSFGVHIKITTLQGELYEKKISFY